MIITCPTCASKYSVQNQMLVDGKMVRCSVCGTTWQQDVEYPTKLAVTSKADRAKKMHWIFFFVIAFSTIIYLVLSTTYITGIPVNIKYLISHTSGVSSKEQFKLTDVSHYFIKKDNGLYLSVTGSIENISKTALSVPYLSINLRTYGEEFANYENPDMFINETWAEKIDSKIIEPNKKIVFETEPRKVPIHDLMCTIKVGKNI